MRSAPFSGGQSLCITDLTRVRRILKNSGGIPIGEYKAIVYCGALEEILTPPVCNESRARADHR